MSRPHQARAFAKPRTRLSLYEPGAEASHATRWRINGHRATVVIWTSEEWERLENRPSDAQRNPCGVWCALRME